MNIIGVVILWLLFFLPTNAHFFLYKQYARNTAIVELKHIDSELEKLSNERMFIESYNAEWNKYENDILSALYDIKYEILDIHYIGPTHRIEDMENLLDLKTGTIARIHPRNNTQNERNKVCEYYDKAVKEQLEIKLQQHNAMVAAKVADWQKKTKNVQPIRNNINITIEQLDDNQYDKEAVLKNARQIIAKGYAELESTFDGLYTKDEKIYRSDRLVKVTKVWGDYFKGKFKKTDYTLWYWILLSGAITITVFIWSSIEIIKNHIAYKRWY